MTTYYSEGFDPHVAICMATIDSLYHYTKINLGVELSAECIDEIKNFIMTHDVEGGIRYFVLKELPEVDLSFETMLKSSEGMTERKVSLWWGPNEKKGDKKNLLKIKIEKTVKEVFKNFCARRSIPLAEEMAEILDFERPVKISLYHKISFYKRMLEKAHSTRGEIVYVGQIPNSTFYFATDEPSAVVNRKENSVMVFNCNAKDFALYKFCLK